MVQEDMTLGLWFGDHKGEWDPPILSYAFNANFVGNGVVRLNAGEIDFPGKNLLELAPFFLPCKKKGVVQPYKGANKIQY